MDKKSLLLATAITFGSPLSGGVYARGVPPDKEQYETQLSRKEHAVLLWDRLQDFGRDVRRACDGVVPVQPMSIEKVIKAEDFRDNMRAVTSFFRRFNSDRNIYIKMLDLQDTNQQRRLNDAMKSAEQAMQTAAAFLRLDENRKYVCWVRSEELRK